MKTEDEGEIMVIGALSFCLQRNSENLDKTWIKDKLFCRHGGKMSAGDPMRRLH